MNYKTITTIKEWYFRYERWISSVSLISGFIFDAIVLKRVDLFIENVWVGVHLLMAALGIVLLNLLENAKEKNKMGEVWQARIHFWLIIFVQFAFGGLLSVFLVFYFRSATLSTSWPFLLILAAAFASNELLKHHYSRLTFQITLLFLSVYSFAIFIVPVLVHQIGAAVFVLSGGISLGIILLFICFLWFITKERFKKSSRMLAISLGSILIIINLLYFTNLIPPIPLSLKDAGIYHSIIKDDMGSYVGTYEKQSWVSFFSTYEHVHIVNGQPLYAFSAVFSPTHLDTSIVHHWQYYDEKKGDWITSSRIILPVIGGRDGGFRTYSSKTEITPGKWRIDVETLEGQHIGRIKFIVDIVNNVPSLQKRLN